jgi:hypothetical protein
VTVLLAESSASGLGSYGIVLILFVLAVSYSRSIPVPDKNAAEGQALLGHRFAAAIFFAPSGLRYDQRCLACA